MSTRIIFSCLAVALATACSFEDTVDHCRVSDECSIGQECYEGFCVRAGSSSRDDAVSGGDGDDGDDDARGGSGGRQSGAGRPGGSGGRTGGSGRSNGAAGADASGGSNSSGGPSAGDDDPEAGAGSPGAPGGGTSGTANPAAGSGAGGTNGGAGSGSSAGQSGGAAGASGTPAADGGMPDPTPGCTMSAAETCNGTDDDCDGTVDEQTTVTCYPDGEAGCTQANGEWACEGVCGLGRRMCTNGQLGECTGFRAPAEEVCTAVGMQGADENCDGRTDETCACMSGEMRSCYSGREGTLDVGRCKAGTQICDQGALGPCMNAVTPGTETCANMTVDDDCDGMLDNVANLGAICVIPSNMGICRAGTLRCEADRAEPACVAVMPLPETCNSLDDDCNGRIDDTFNLQTDRDNCGTCGTKCAEGESCTGGRCTARMPMEPMEPMEPMPMPMPGTCSPACAEGQECCGGSCVNLSDDVRNCGGCGMACTAGAQPACCNGRCVDLVSNSNCGQCGRDCSLLTSDTLTCTCTMGGDGRVACTGPLLNLCL